MGRTKDSNQLFLVFAQERLVRYCENMGNNNANIGALKHCVNFDCVNLNYLWLKIRGNIGAMKNNQDLNNYPKLNYVVTKLMFKLQSLKDYCHKPC